MGWKWELSADRHKRSFGSDGNVLKLDCGDSWTACKDTKNHWIVHLSEGFLWYLNYTNEAV